MLFCTQPISENSIPKGHRNTNVDSPEFFDGAECDDFLEKIVPVIALFVFCYQSAFTGHLTLVKSCQYRTLPLGGLVNQRVHSFIKGCLTLKFSGSWKTVTISFSPLGAVAFSSIAGAAPFSVAVAMMGNVFSEEKRVEKG
jgi:hypothetical protein